MTQSLGTATIRVVANTAQFESNLKRSLGRMSTLAAGLGAGLAGASFLQGAVKDSISLERQIARINSLTQDPALKNYFDPQNVRALSNETGIASNKIAEQLFFIRSSGTDVADAMNVMREAVKTAVVQNVDLGTVTDFTTSILNVYGGTLDKLTGKITTAATIQDTFNKALDLGKAPAADLARFLPTMAGAAKSVGVPFSDLASFLSTMSLSFPSTRKNANGLRLALQGLSDPTKNLGKVFKDVAGKDFKTFIDQGGNLYDAVKLLQEKIGAKDLIKIPGVKESLTTLQQAMTLMPEYKKNTEALAGASGTTAAKSAALEKTLSRQLEHLKVNFLNFRGSVGDWLGPVLQDGINGLKAHGPEWEAAWAGLWATVGPAATLAFRGLWEALKLVFTVVNNMKPVIVGLTAAFLAYKAAAVATALWSGIVSVAMGIQTLAAGGLAGAWLSLNIIMAANPIGLTVAALAALAVGLTYAWKTSETFRDIVKGAFVAIAIGVGVAVKAVIAMAALWANSYLYSFKLVLQGLAHLPDWLGGGKFESAANAVQRVIDGVDAIKGSLYGLVDAAVNAARSLAAVVSVQNEGFGTQGLDQVYAQLAKDYPDLGKAAAATPKGSGYSGGGGGSYNPDAGKATADAKKAAAKVAKAAMKSAGTIFKKLVANISDLTADQIKTRFADLFAKLKEAGRKDLIAPMTKYRDKILGAAKAHDAIVKKLKSANDALKDLRDTAKAYRADIKAAVIDLGNVTKDNTYSELLGPDANKMLNNLQGAVGATKQFVTVFKQLRSMGLDKGILRQLMDAGVVGGLAAGQAILTGGQAAVDNFNFWQAQLKTAGGDLGDIGYDTFYANGIKTAQGLVDGLKDQEELLSKTMTSLGKRMAKAFKDELGIKSPSKVFEAAGLNLGAGLAKGIDASQSMVANSMSRLTPGSNLGRIPTQAGAGGGVVVNSYTYLDGQELKGVVRTEINNRDRTIKARATARSKSGAIHNINR